MNTEAVETYCCNAALRIIRHAEEQFRKELEVLPDIDDSSVICAMIEECMISMLIKGIIEKREEQYRLDFAKRILWRLPKLLETARPYEEIVEIINRMDEEDT